MVLYEQPGSWLAIESKSRSIGRWGPVWPDVGVKSTQFSTKVAHIVAIVGSCTSKVPFFTAAKKSHNVWAIFDKKKLSQDLSKVA